MGITTPLRYLKVPLTLTDATILLLSVRHLPPTTVTILVDHDRYYVTATIDGTDHELGRYPTATAAGAALVKWLNDRGLSTAPGSGNRLAEAQRLGGCCVTFDIVTREEWGDEWPL